MFVKMNQDYEERKKLEFFDKELERLHNLLLSKVDYDICKYDIEQEIKKIHDHMILVSKRYNGMEY